MRGIAMHGMEVHCQQREVDVVSLGDRPAWAMLVDIPDRELLEIAAVTRAIPLLPHFFGLHAQRSCLNCLFVRTKYHPEVFLRQSRVFTEKRRRGLYEKLSGVLTRVLTDRGSMRRVFRKRSIFDFYQLTL